MTSELNQRIVGVSHTDCEAGDRTAYAETASGAASASHSGMSTTPNKRPRPHSHNYSGPTSRALKAFLVASVVTLLALITTASTSGKIEELRASLAAGFFEDEGGDKVIMDGSAPRRDCGLTQEAWNRAVGLERHDPCRDTFIRASGLASDAYAKRRAGSGDGEDETSGRSSPAVRGSSGAN